MNKTIIIYKKELKEIFKDKKAIFMTIFFPVILYPILIFISSLLAVKGQDRVEKTLNIIAVEKKVDKKLVDEILKEKTFKLISADNYEKEINDKRLDLYLKFNDKKNEFEVFYNSTKDESKSALDKLEKYIKEYKETKQKAFFKEKGISEDFLKRYSIKENNLATKEKMTNQIMGIVLPLIIILPLLGSIMFSALDLTSGEKERKTIETLFILPVKTESIMLAKLFAVVTMGIFGTIINFLGMLITFFAAKTFVPQVNEFLGKSLDYTLIFKCLIMVIPLIFIISGIGLITGLLSKDYKEAQNYITPIYLLFMIPIYFIISPGWNLEGIFTYIPVLNVFLLFKGLSLGEINLLQMFLVFLTNTSFAVMVLIIFGKLFNSETILFIDEKGFNFSFKRKKIPEKKGLEVSEIILFYVITMTLLLIFGGVLQLKYGILGLFLSQILLLLFPVLLLIRFLNLDYKKLFPIKKIKLSETFNIISFWMVTLIIVGLITSVQLKFFPGQLEDLEALGDFFKNTKLWEQILIFSLTPAICEELLFRGLIFGSLKEKMNTNHAIVISGFLFGLFHIYPGKILSTAILGMLFAYAVAKTGTLITGMVLHFINNLFSLVVSEQITKYQNNLVIMAVIGTIMIMLSINGTVWFLRSIKNKNSR